MKETDRQLQWGGQVGRKRGGEYRLGKGWRRGGRRGRGAPSSVAGSRAAAPFGGTAPVIMHVGAGAVRLRVLRLCRH